MSGTRGREGGREGGRGGERRERGKEGGGREGRKEGGGREGGKEGGGRKQLDASESEWFNQRIIEISAWKNQMPATINVSQVLAKYPK